MTWIYRTRKKSDRIDAQKQAKLLQMDLIPAVHMPSVGVRQWRSEIQHRRRLMGISVKLKNRIRSVVKNHGYRQAGFRGGWWNRGNRAWMLELGQANEKTWGISLLDMLDQLALTEKQIQRATKRLDERLKDNPQAKRLMTIPGVGPRTTEAVLAYTDDVTRFGSGKAYGSYFGMTPKLDQSGQVCRQGHISKQGPSAVRWLIVESSWRALRKSPGLAKFYQRVKHGQAKRKKIAIVATARKLLGIMRAMLLHGTDFEESRVLESRRQTIKAQLKTFYN